MPRPKKGPRLGSNPGHQKLLLSTLAKQLFANEAIRRKDDLEDAGRWVSPLTRAVAGLPRKLGFNLGPTTW